MPHLAQSIANEFLKADGCLHPMKLQKLVYIAHGWNLAVNGTALVNVTPEAWDNGPVFRNLYREYRYGRTGENCMIYESEDTLYQAKLSAPERRVIEAVWDKYGGCSANELSQMTHRQGTPWTETYLNEGRDKEIPNKKIRSHFVRIAKNTTAPSKAIFGE